MNRSLLSFLGRLARFMRAIGLRWLLDVSRDAIDEGFLRLGRPPLALNIEDLQISGYLRHRSFLEHLGTRTYEPYSRRLFEEALIPGVTVVDAGAHIGLYSILATRIVGSHATVIAFEPDLYNFRALTFNLEANDCSNVIPVRKALSDSIGTAWFWRNPGTISSSLFRRTDIGKTSREQCSVTTLDAELQGLDIERLVVKLDIEGAELRALKGMANLLKRAKNVILLIEVNPNALRDAGTEPLRVIEILRRFKFQIDFVDDVNSVLRPVVPDAIQKGNLYCVRRS